MTVNDDYKTIRLPKPLIDKIDQYIKEHPEYNSRADLLKEAIRMHIKESERK